MGCNDIVELARMFDATSHVGLRGVGWGVMTSLNLHACLMLRHTWGGVGWGDGTCAAQTLVRHLATWSMLLNVQCKFQISTCAKEMQKVVKARC